MNKICILDLSSNLIEFRPYSFEQNTPCGRSLAVTLLQEQVDAQTQRYSPDNSIVFAPGLFAGTTAPTSGRLTLATKEGQGQGLKICNLTGAMPQKLASAGIAALVIKGKSSSQNTVVYISDAEVRVEVVEGLTPKTVPQIITALREKYPNAAIMGTGPAAEAQMPLATVFSTYPEGDPSYYCTRGAFGDIWSSKGLKAVVVDQKSYFKRSYHDKPAFLEAGRQLAQLITQDAVCGGALPRFGSITLINLLKNKGKLAFPPPESNEIPQGTFPQQQPALSNAVKRNKTCCPGCVIGCLNRHAQQGQEAFTSPAESEVNAALLHCFDWNDAAFSRKINARAFELGLDSTEFVFSAHLYLTAAKIAPTRETVNALLDEIEQTTVIGRVVGSKTVGIQRLFGEQTELVPLVTRPVIQQEKEWSVAIKPLFPAFHAVDPMELLYSQIFVLENLGFCIFSSFALLNKVESFTWMAEMVHALTGVPTTPEALIAFAQRCIAEEVQLEQALKEGQAQKNIPEFTKVLYRYFSSTQG